MKSAAVTLQGGHDRATVSLGAPGVGGSTSDSGPVFTGSAGPAPPGDSLPGSAPSLYSGLTDTGTPVGTFTGNRSRRVVPPSRPAALCPWAPTRLAPSRWTPPGTPAAAPPARPRSPSAAPAANLRDTMMATPRAPTGASVRRAAPPPPIRQRFANSGAYLWGSGSRPGRRGARGPDTAIALDGAGVRERCLMGGSGAAPPHRGASRRAGRPPSSVSRRLAAGAVEVTANVRAVLRPFPAASTCSARGDCPRAECCRP